MIECSKVTSVLSMQLLFKLNNTIFFSLFFVHHPDSSLVVSKGTLIICPASLIHHWKKEIERHVKTGKLTVYLYHGPNREKSAKV